MIQAVVFDFDGVIANSEPLHFRAFRDVLAQTGIALTERDYYDRYLGFDDVGAFQAIADHVGAPLTGAGIAARERMAAIEREIMAPRAAAAPTPVLAAE